MIHAMPGSELTWGDVLQIGSGHPELAKALQGSVFKTAQQMTLPPGPKAEVQKSEIQVTQAELRKGWQRVFTTVKEVRSNHPRLIFPPSLTIRLSKDFWYQDLNRKISQQINSQAQFSQIQTDLDMTKLQGEELLAPYWDLSHLKLGSQLIAYSTSAGKKWLSINVRAFRKVWVTSRNLRQGEILAPKLVELRQVEVTFRDDFVSEEAVYGLNLRRSLPAQTPLLASDVLKTKLVRFGQMVEVSSSDAEHSITVRGVAQRDGVQGDRIPILISDTKKTIEATIKSANEVVLE
jgi:flagella basal body P-ring formation protein FlgA